MFVWGNAVKGDKETMFSDNFYRSLCITSNLTQWKLVNPEPLDEPLEKKNNFSWKIGHMVIKLYVLDGFQMKIGRHYTKH